MSPCGLPKDSVCLETLLTVCWAPSCCDCADVLSCPTGEMGDASLMPPCEDKVPVTLLVLSFAAFSQMMPPLFAVRGNVDCSVGRRLVSHVLLSCCGGCGGGGGGEALLSALPALVLAALLLLLSLPALATAGCDPEIPSLV